MPGPNSGNTVYTCTCTRFCKGYKTGLSRATYYRHAPYCPSEFSASFQAFLQNSESSVPQANLSTGTSSNLTLAVDEEDFQDEIDETFDNNLEVSRILFFFKIKRWDHLVFIFLYPSLI